MAGEFKFGAVLSWKRYVFDDGGTSDKLLIVLGAKAGKPWILALTTSRPPPKKYPPGCTAVDGMYFVPGDGKSFFKKDTWVQLYRPRVAQAAEIMKRSLASELTVIGNMPAQVANAIRNCLKQSEDVSPYHVSLLD
jgi:hypothetical protein